MDRDLNVSVMLDVRLTSRANWKSILSSTGSFEFYEGLLPRIENHNSSNDKFFFSIKSSSPSTAEFEMRILV